MPDPIDELENFSIPGPTMTPLPASEVRRRGDRLRRRHHALVAGGVLAVVAVIAVPFAIAAGGQSTSGPDPVPPATQPAVVWATTIPADFPLTDGLPARNGHDGSPVEARDGYQTQAVDVCTSEGWSSDRTSDVRQAVYTGETEGGQDRGLALYPDDLMAEDALGGQTAKVERCAAQSAGETRYAEVLPSDLGEGSLVYVDHLEGGAMFVHQVVRVGNALLVDSVYAMGGGDPAVVQQTVDLLEEQSAGVVDAMCEFASDGCS